MPEITNMGFVNDKGEHVTRCWNTNHPRGFVMYERPTRPEDIRPQAVNHCWHPGEPEDESRGHRGRPGTIEGIIEGT